MSGPTHRLIIAFDSGCLMCSSGIHFLAEHDSNDRFRFTPLQSETGRRMLSSFGENPPDSVLVDTGDKVIARSNAILAIARALPFPWNLPAYPATLIPLCVREAIYDSIARHRYDWFGKANACQLPGEELKKRLI